jgi:hypothetical protein
MNVSNNIVNWGLSAELVDTAYWGLKRTTIGREYEALTFSVRAFKSDFVLMV